MGETVVLEHATGGQAPDETGEPRPGLTMRVRPFVFPAVVGLCIAAVAVTLRVWQISATYETSDQAVMPYLVRHSYGMRWILAHDYGPVFAGVQRGFAEVLETLGVPQGEATGRLPTVLSGLSIVAMAYVLSRRLGRGLADGLLAAGVCAVLPPLVSDARYAWGYQSAMLLTGIATLWSMLAYVDTGLKRYLLGSAILLFLHCLSGLYAFALPVTLIVGWVWQSRTTGGTPRWRVAVPVVGFVLPCVLALVVITASWWWTGGGQLGRLLGKQRSGYVGLHWEQLAGLPAMWVGECGIVFAVVTAVALAWGTRALLRGERHGLLAAWAWASLLPITLAVDWHCTGYINYFFLEPLFATSVLAAFLVGQGLRSGGGRRWVCMAAAAGSGIQLAAGSVHVVRPTPELQHISRMWVGEGDVRPDSGSKAAGWYVRLYVPDEAVVLSMHGHEGMELPVAEYYCGRKILAHYNLPAEVVAPLMETMRKHVDVVIAPAGYRVPEEFRPVCTIRACGEIIRVISARQGPVMPVMDIDVATANAAYDELFRLDRVPVPLPDAPRFLDALQVYQGEVHRLLVGRRSSSGTDPAEHRF